MPVDNSPGAEPRAREPRDLEIAVARQARRRMRTLAGEGRGVLFWVGMFGLVGWSVAIPTLLGTALGIYVDRRWPSEFSWTLMLLFAGLAVGCFTAWRWLHSESEEIEEQEKALQREDAAGSREAKAGLMEGRTNGET